MAFQETKEWTPPLPAQSCKPAKTTHFAGGRLDDTTTYNTTHLGQLGQTRRPFNPQISAYKAPGKLSSDTSARLDYVYYQGVKPRSPFKPQSKSDTFGEDRTFQTESAVQFNDKGTQIRRPVQPDKGNIMPSTAKFQGDSVTKSDFGWKTTERAQPMKTSAVSYSTVGGPDNRDFQSEAMTRFTSGEYVPPVQTLRPNAKSNTLDSGKTFEGVPTSKTDYVFYEGAKPASRIDPLKSSLGDPNTQFEGVTSYSTTFTGEVQPVRRSLKQAPLQIGSKGKFDGRTCNKEHFPHWENARPSAMAKPIKRASDEQQDSRTFQTESAIQFNDKGLNARRSMRPVHTSLQSLSTDAPFEAESVTKQDFVEWQMPPKRAPFKPTGQLTTHEDVGDGRDFVSTSASTFTGTYIPPLQTLRPRPTVNNSRAKFKGETEQSQKYVNYWQRPE